MTRLSDAYASLDAAVRELLAAADEADGAAEDWTVTDYLLFAGQSRITPGGGLESDHSMFTPFAGDYTYQLKGLLAEFDLKLDVHDLYEDSDSDMGDDFR